MADIKEKGILHEDDDAPIKLTDQDDFHVIKEYRMFLIGKILNPKKQNVEKLLQTMPNQWGMEDRITSNDMENGKFLFNFTSEDDLNFVLRKGLFHYNYCMFLLVRWELTVHDDYPWIIPFWVQLIGKVVCSSMLTLGVLQSSKERFNLLRERRHYHSKSTTGAGWCVCESTVALRSAWNIWYGGSRYGTGPYDRIVELTWREKSKAAVRKSGKFAVLAHNVEAVSRDVVPYEKISNFKKNLISDELFHRNIEEHMSDGKRSNKRLASTIVIPSRQITYIEDNVTIRNRSVARSLTFSPSNQVPADEIGNDQIIGTLNDMELLEQNDGGMMDYDVHDDDLLGDELIDMEDNMHSSSVVGPSSAQDVKKI
ncbi:hypothetical protein F2Q68_00043191 [Brassica cretica]|uniref:DUF4283 domain-containing protein n=1 Tax=Brassica cretica TaxID=69181 RepID=A0A8S9LQU3_BRACR|nr:hypothetical protein F2Q68_00043191 [Brassica cretica]